MRLAVLAAAIVASSMSYIDSTALTVALPVIETRLGASGAQAQWIIEGYLLLLSALILIGGALGDRYGRRRLFELGTWLFTLSSIACALSPNVRVLIAARCVQGAGAALMIPESLALITATFAPAERGRAIGIWAAASAATMAAGPVLAGWLTQTLSWRWVFWINVPLAVVVLALSYLRVPESKAHDAGGQPDVLGSACITASLAVIVVALTQMQESAARVPFELQHVMTYTPFAAGLSLLPTIAIIAAGSPIAGTFGTRVDARIPLAGGAAIAAVGFVLFARLISGANYAASVLPATIVVGIGLAIAVAPLTATLMGCTDPDDVGAASGINNAISRIGGLVAIAALGIAIAAHGGGALPTRAHPAGFQDAMFGAAAMAFAAALVATFLPGFPRTAGIRQKS